MNATLNLGRAQVLRVVAKWLDANPSLPIARLSLTKHGEVEIIPADAHTGDYRQQEIHGLYALAEAVGADVELTPVGYHNGGWDLTAQWTVGVVPITARVRIYRAAADVRPVTATPASDTAPADRKAS